MFELWIPFQNFSTIFLTDRSTEYRSTGWPFADRCHHFDGSLSISPGPAIPGPLRRRESIGCIAHGFDPDLWVFREFKSCHQNTIRLIDSKRPTRPLSWCIWDNPNLSAFSMIMTLALGTPTLTSITVGIPDLGFTLQWTAVSPVLLHLISCGQIQTLHLILSWGKTATTFQTHCWEICRSSFSDSSISGYTINLSCQAVFDLSRIGSVGDDCAQKKCGFDRLSSGGNGSIMLISRFHSKPCIKCEGSGCRHDQDMRYHGFWLFFAKD